MPKEKMNTLLKKEVNTLAANFYQMAGRKFMSELDFSKSSHPEEYGNWNKACVAFAFIKKDEWFLRFQVTSRSMFDDVEEAESDISDTDFNMSN